MSFCNFQPLLLFLFCFPNWGPICHQSTILVAIDEADESFTDLTLQRAISLHLTIRLIPIRRPITSLSLPTSISVPSLGFPEVLNVHALVCPSLTLDSVWGCSRVSMCNVFPQCRSPLMGEWRHACLQDEAKTSTVHQEGSIDVRYVIAVNQSQSMQTDSIFT